MSALECTEYDKLKADLVSLGLYEDDMNEDDMLDLMAAIRNSEDSALNEEWIRESNNSKKIQESSSEESMVREVKRGMERRYKNVPERRLPWNLFPFPEKLSLEQKSKILAAYKEQLTACQYRKARTCSVFAEWNCVYKLPLNPVMEYKSASLHHTRSGRTIRSTPQYADNDSDTEIFSNARKARKKVRKLTSEEIISKSSLFKDVSNVDRSKETDKQIDNSDSCGKVLLSEHSVSLAKRSKMDEDKPIYIGSPEYGTDVTVQNEETRATTRKRARLQNESNIQ